MSFRPVAQPQAVFRPLDKSYAKLCDSPAEVTYKPDIPRVPQLSLRCKFYLPTFKGVGFEAVYDSRNEAVRVCSQ